MENGFIAYVGTEIDEKEIKKLLATISVDRTKEDGENYKPRTRKGAGAILGQVIESDSELEYSLPYVYNNDWLYVAGYNYNQFESVADDFAYDNVLTVLKI